MSRFLAITSLIVLSLSCFAQELSQQTSVPIKQQVDEYVKALMEAYGIPGAAVAVIKNNDVIHQANYGFANWEHQVPVTDQSIFRVYSLTKPIVAVGIFQLIEEKKIRLNDPISRYVPHLPASWQAIKIKHLLSHSAGLPDMAPIPAFQNLNEEQAAEKVFEQACRFKPGERYDYNQTGFWLLQQVIEAIEQKEMATWIAERQFESPCDTAFFSSDSRDIIRHRATPYFPFTKSTVTIDHSYLQGTYGHAINGLNITLNEFIRWDSAFRNDRLISAATKAQMWESFRYANSDKSFAYGWDKRGTTLHPSYGFSGSLVTAYRVFPTQNMSIIFLSNGLSRFYNIEQVIDDLATLVVQE